MDFWQEGDWIAGHDDNRIECNSLFCRQTRGRAHLGLFFPHADFLWRWKNANLTCLQRLQGKIYVRGDSKVFRFQNGKSESLFLQRKNPRRIAWTVLYRRQHKKGITEVRYCHNPPPPGRHEWVPHHAHAHEHTARTPPFRQIPIPR